MIPLLNRGIAILLFLFLFFAGLHYAADFLIPVTIASFLAMLFIPLCVWLENKGMHNAFAALICALIFLVACASLVFLVSWQIGNFAEDTQKLQEMVTGIANRIQHFVAETMGISREQQQQMITEQKKSGGQQASRMVMGTLGSVSSILIKFVLVLVYIFLFLYFRKHLKAFLMKMFSGEEKKNALKIAYDASQVGQNYISGLARMIFILWIMYGIGFSIVGVKYALFFAVLCGILEIVPFVGNLTGTALTLLMAVSQGAGSGMLIGILITYSLVQFIQSYILEPLVVGAKVNINPLFTIVVLVIGEMVWGIAGLILAIPLLGVFKIICDHINPLKPIGYLIGETRSGKKDSPFMQKIKSLFGAGSVTK